MIELNSFLYLNGIVGMGVALLPDRLFSTWLLPYPPLTQFS